MSFGGDISLIYLRHIYEWDMNGNLGLGRKHISITTFMKRIQFCILIGNEKEESSDILGMRTDLIDLTITSHQCCVLVILRKYYFPKRKVIPIVLDMLLIYEVLRWGKHD